METMIASWWWIWATEGGADKFPEVVQWEHMSYALSRAGCFLWGSSALHKDYILWIFMDHILDLCGSASASVLYLLMLSGVRRWNSYWIITENPRGYAGRQSGVQGGWTSWLRARYLISCWWVESLLLSPLDRSLVLQSRYHLCFTKDETEAYQGKVTAQGHIAPMESASRITLKDAHPPSMITLYSSPPECGPE